MTFKKPLTVCSNINLSVIGIRCGLWCVVQITSYQNIGHCKTNSCGASIEYLISEK